MAIIVLILGESGTGKSTSLRNFRPGELSIINVAGKPLPFKMNLRTLNSSNYDQIITALKRAQAKSIVIDDCQYLMAFEFMNKAMSKGYDKFTEMGSNFFNLIQTAINLQNDKIIYFLSHIETLNDGKEKCKTIGKLLDEKITIEGLFSIVLKTTVLAEQNRRQFYFATQNNGNDTVKSPMGMFDDLLIPNDLKAVDTVIREYYGLPRNEFLKTNKTKE